MPEEEEGSTEKRTTPPPPYPIALVICDAIWKDPWTGKRTLIGLFSILHAAQFPAAHPILSIHSVVTNGRGRVSLKVRLVDVDEEREPLFEMGGDVEFTDPRMVGEFDAVARNVVFPVAGEYRVQLLANGELLMERRIIVADLTPPEEP